MLHVTLIKPFNNFTLAPPREFHAKTDKHSYPHPLSQCDYMYSPRQQPIHKDLEPDPDPDPDPDPNVDTLTHKHEIPYSCLLTSPPHVNVAHLCMSHIPVMAESCHKQRQLEILIPFDNSATCEHHTRISESRHNDDRVMSHTKSTYNTHAP